MEFIISPSDSPVIKVNDRFLSGSRVMTGLFVLFIAFCAVLSLSYRDAGAQERGPSQQATEAIDGAVYRIPVRVHVGKSGRSPKDFTAILEEINDIWLSQAGICFEMQIVLDDKLLEQGMDIWFMPLLPGGSGLNGFFRDDHNIQVRDTPVLRPASHPANYPAARTAAHEFGHGLSLHHRQNSDDNLMRSKSFGWHLNGNEIKAARNAAAKEALLDTAPRKCEEPVIVSP